jgi:phosphoribosyl 1,2-cyclic phosphodiesterase
VTTPTDFSLRFWGVRGSIACPGARTLRYGGNTSCIEIKCGDHLFIIDGGTGIYPLGRELASRGGLDADLFFTHTHHDHISGFPFFGPAYDPRNSLRLHAGHLKPHNLSLHETLAAMMVAPTFPVPIDLMEECCEFHDFEAGDELNPREGVVVKTGPLNHPNEATGYRIEYGGRVLCIITDTEHVPGKMDENVLALVQDADVMVYDSTYTDEEYPSFEGWGHSTWQEAVRIAQAANVKQVLFFHHDPSHNDDFMDEVARQARELMPNASPAVEGEITYL